MPVSSYVLLCRPADQAAVRRHVAGLVGLADVKIGEGSELGLPVAVSTDSVRAAEEAGDRLRLVPGVRSATLVYHNFEDAD